MIGKSRYWSLVSASPGWCEPGTVAGIEWACEMVRERLVAVSGSPPLKGQGIEKSVPGRDSFALRWHSEMSISSYCG